MDVTPIGYVVGGRTDPVDDDWDAEAAVIRLDDRFAPDALRGLEAFSHLEVVYRFHLVDEDNVHSGARRPRGNPDWPEVGILAQRGKDRPNRIGICTAELIAADGATITVRGLDAIDGTPVRDVKPDMREFGPRGQVRPPAWADAIMAGYF